MHGTTQTDDETNDETNDVLGQCITQMARKENSMSHDTILVVFQPVFHL